MIDYPNRKSEVGRRKKQNFYCKGIGFCKSQPSIVRGEIIDTFMIIYDQRLGLSSNLDKWAFRPEIGYDGFFSFGFGINAYMKK